MKRYLTYSCVGVVIFLALTAEKGTLIVYDPVKNRMQSVGGVPDIIVAFAALTNSIERGVVEMISVTGDPVGIKTNNNGVGFDTLLNISSKGVRLWQHSVLSEAQA